MSLRMDCSLAKPDLYWCLLYVLRFWDHNKNYRWIYNIENLESFYNKRVLKKHGFICVQDKSYVQFFGNDGCPLIVKLKNGQYVIMKNFGLGMVYLQHPQLQEISMTDLEFEQCYSGLLWYIYPLNLVQDYKNLSRQLCYFVIKRIIAFPVFGISIVCILLCYELFSLIEPILLNLVVLHLDLFGSMFDLLMVLGMLACVLSLSLGIAFFRQRLWVEIFGKLSITLSNELFFEFLTLALSPKDREASEYFSSVYSLDQVCYRLLQQFFFTGLDLVFLLIYFVLMSYCCSKLVILDLVFLLCMFLVNLKFTKKFYDKSEETLLLHHSCSLYLLDILQQLFLIKRSKLQWPMMMRWQKIKQSYWEGFLETENMQNVSEWLLLSLKKMNGLLMMIFGIYLILNHHLSLGGFIGFWTLKSQLFTRFEGCLKRVLQWQYLKAALDRFVVLLVTQKDLSEISGTVQCLYQNEDIVFHDVSIRGIHFKNYHFKLGKKYLLSGPSGCGKSSLLLGLVGALPLDSGSVSYAGRLCYLDEWHRMHQDIVFVMQNESLFKASFIDNICLFAQDIEEQHFNFVIDFVGLRTILNTLPYGIHTLMGSDSYQLSGGQIQRVLLARALYHKPKWLILDEATCHLDVSSERWLVEKLLHLDVSMIVVNHRVEFKTMFDECIDLFSDAEHAR